MPLPGTRSEIYRFGAFELESATGELRKHGLRLKLQDQPVRLLVLLLENAGEVVSREQIQELWNRPMVPLSITTCTERS
jgi:DNA-binding winged helix-turn-helix (wHTH) protein